MYKKKQDRLLMHPQLQAYPEFSILIIERQLGASEDDRVLLALHHEGEQERMIVKANEISRTVAGMLGVRFAPPIEVELIETRPAKKETDPNTKKVSREPNPKRKVKSANGKPKDSRDGAKIERKNPVQRKCVASRGGHAASSSEGRACKGKTCKRKTTQRVRAARDS